MRCAEQNSGAIIVGTYRYRLWRTIDNNRNSRRILFVMLNPSTAEATQDDPTLRRCIGFASDWGYGVLEVCNLFAYRATDPDVLVRTRDPVGPDNDAHLLATADRADAVVAAWGTRGELFGRASQATSMLSRSRHLICLGMTRNGSPRHPLYVPRSMSPVTYAPQYTCNETNKDR
jgi:hypothetical protein